MRVIETYVRIMQRVKPERGWRIAETGNLSATAELLKSEGFTVEVLRGDSRYRIDAQSASVDLLLSCEVFEHVKDQDAQKFDDLVCMNFSGLRAYIGKMYRVLCQTESSLSRPQMHAPYCTLS